MTVELGSRVVEVDRFSDHWILCREMWHEAAAWQFKEKEKQKKTQKVGRIVSSVRLFIELYFPISDG